MATPTAIVAYLGLFAGVAVLFLFVNLLVGRFLRPRLPNREKLEIYECGEPTIGSSFVQFDLRFYVVALLFIIFDVEVAFFFPWATVFGKAAQLASPNMPVLAADVDPAGSSDALSAQAIVRLRELGIANPTLATAIETSPAELGGPGARGPVAGGPDGDGKEAGGGGARGGNLRERNRESIRQAARRIAAASLVDIGVFFGVLMVGFAYVWKRGDLDWVRSVSSQQGQVVERRPTPPRELDSRRRQPAESILSA